METADLKQDVSQNGVAHPTGDDTRLRDLSSQQWKSGIAAWLGWTFDGLELHLYTLVAAPFVAQLLNLTDTTDARVGRYGSIIQAGFLVGWALGGGFFGRIGDRLGRSRALCLTVLTYATCTGLAVFAQTWWHLLIFRFIAALGIGGEWAVGASLLSETWPKKWRTWIAGVLQCGVNIGILMAAGANRVMSSAPPRYIFLVGVIPALLVFWIRRAVPETEEWHAAKKAQEKEPGILDLFGPGVRKITLWTLVVCAISLSAHWAFMFWHLQHVRNLPEVLLMTPEQKNNLASLVLYLVIASSIVGNFFAAWIARKIGYRATIAWMCLGYFLAMMGAYCVPRDHHALLYWFPCIGFFQGLFALFTMYLPPLFPTLLRTTGAGFCYNIGRIAAAFGTVFFGLFSKVGDHRMALLYAGLLFLPASVVSFMMPKVRD
ncbi:MFS transporter [Pedosphaera parvula]|uniref:Major facilitator superfamily MFS_1 n=1 Tax=Pedosphaera parvula (strain Ellin514) TaxID=320771 RepID=B9XCB0_PEDPL|nr:MFS transporter [Pedosphaera parvula]EEF62578.1 major facilitator superfamily MFS_1 [Pedosphaera parvula Ellin514]